MSEDNGSSKTVILDLGKQKSKKVKNLRKGKGPLMSDVNTAVAELRADGLVGADAQVVVVVVERKADKFGLMGPMANLAR